MNYMLNLRRCRQRVNRPESRNHDDAFRGHFALPMLPVYIG